ncbi:MAG: thioesterase family protein [Pirellulales bacterium]
MPGDVPNELSEFPVVVTLPVQWGDQDAFQHVNNTVYFRWFESARIEYMERMGLNDLMDRQRIGAILAAISCNYRRPLTFPDTVHAGARVTRLGRTSLTMEHRLYSEAHKMVAADGESTLVIFDYNSERPHAIPDEVRAAIAELEKKGGGG